MELLGVLLGLVVLATPIAAFVAFARTSSLRQRIDDLERELRQWREGRGEPSREVPRPVPPPPVATRPPLAPPPPSPPP